MLNLTNLAADIEEPRSARMEQRTKPAIKAQIQQAAALLGVDETTFVTSVALERAKATLADHERTLLSAKDREMVLSMLESPPAPTAALREAIAQHDAKVASDV
ncbi:MAG: DUF1778 domain-containing protein [Gammaproteobacteria bacterium]|nr:DUF1778 domain-containing protein [Gammaproteobacteria bacterium]MYL12569.1 DUF1778 domain-containing protein [Gammaproteobacteria bacterium]